MRILEQAHDLLVIQRYIRCLHLGQILQHTDHRGIIMTEDIQFQEVMVNLVIVKMCSDGILIRGRMLDRCEAIDILTVGKNDNSSGVLPGGLSNIHDPFGQAVQFSCPAVNPFLLKILLNVAVRCLVRDTRNSTRAECLPGAEDDLGILMCLRLVFTGEVQVDIRLFISLESQECLERNVESQLIQFGPAPRAVPVRHVTSGHTVEFPNFLRIKIIVMTGGAQIMRMQGIDLRNAGHVRDKGRSDRSSGSDQITVGHRLPHQLLRDDVHDCESIGDDGIQLLLQPVLDDLRQLFPVDLMCLVIADAGQHLI